MQRGLGALAMAASSSSPASSNLKRLFTRVNGVEDPATALGAARFSEGRRRHVQHNRQLNQPPRQDVRSEDSLDDVRLLGDDE